MLRLDDGVDRVACGAGAVVHDGPLLADEAVEQRRLADVRTPDDGNAHHPRRDFLVFPGQFPVPRRCLLGKHVEQAVEQVAGPPPVQGADRYRIAQAQ